MKIGVLTGGGDCQGLNAAIRAVVRRADSYGWDVMGIRNGWAGLLGEGDLEPLLPRDVAGILPLGGTILGTSRTNPAKNAEHMQQVISNLRKNGLDALVAIGGDDTLGVASKLYDEGYPTVGVPKTMDNDLSETDFTIGFNSAATIATDAIDKLHTTAASHRRVIVVEVMGRDAGWVAVVAGMAGGADYIIVPEVPTRIEDVCEHLRRRRDAGSHSGIVVVSEAATVTDFDVKGDEQTRDAFGHVQLGSRNFGEVVAREIERRTGIETRSVVLGHLQRGGAPTVFDRVLGTRMGSAAVDYVKEGKFGYMPALQGTKIVPVKIKDAVGRTKTIDLDLYEVAKDLF